MTTTSPVFSVFRRMMPSLTCWRPNLTASPRRKPVYRDGTWPVVRQDDDAGGTAEGWHEWAIYLRRIGLGFVPSTLTVPEDRPWVFDRSYQAPVPSYIPVARRYRGNDDMRQRIAGLFRSTVKTMQGKYLPKTPQSHLVEPSAPAPDPRAPVGVSPELAARLGQPVTVGEAYQSLKDWEDAEKKIKAA